MIEDSAKIVNEEGQGPGQPHRQQPRRRQRPPDRPKDRRQAPFGKAAEAVLTLSIEVKSSS